MTDIPLPTGNDIYSYGFDKSLNKPVGDSNEINNNLVNQVRNIMLQSGIDINTVNKSIIGSGNFDLVDFHWFTLFESLDGFAKILATMDENNGRIIIAAPAVLNGIAQLIKNYAYPLSSMTFDKKRRLQTKVYINDNSGQLIYIILGDVGNLNSNHFGFMIQDNILYGTWGNAAIGQQSIQLKTINAGAVIVLKALLENNLLTWYVDDVKIVSITGGLPSGTVNANLLCSVYIKSTDGFSHVLRLSYWDFWQAN